MLTSQWCKLFSFRLTGKPITEKSIIIRVGLHSIQSYRMLQNCNPSAVFNMSGCFFFSPQMWRSKRLLMNNATVFYFSYQKQMQLISKWNGKNFYGIESDWSIHEIVKERGKFYRTKYVIGEWLRPIGNPLKKSEFYF